MQDNIIDRRSFFKLGLLGGSVVVGGKIKCNHRKIK